MKKKGKKEKSRKKMFLSELETITYEQQLIDDNRQLARLRVHNEELEKKVENLKEKLNELEENKTDLTLHLRQVLQKKTTEAYELHERLLALEKLYNEEQLSFKKKEESLEYEFRTMEHNLNAEIKLAAGKLNSLEEWRLHRIDLIKKFEKQEKIMIDQEIRHKKILYEVEKTFIIEKTRMQKQLENRLSELSKSFRTATSLRLADATRWAICENISLHKELNCLLSQCRELNSTVMDYKEQERTWRIQSRLYEAEANLALEKVVKQSQVIKHLAIEHDHMGKAVEWARRGQKYALHGEKARNEVRRNYVEIRNTAHLLEQNIEITCFNKEDAMKQILGNCHKIQKLNEILTKAKETIKQALMVQSELVAKEGCSMCFFNIKEKLLRSLFEILESYQESKIKCETETESNSIENLYEFGNLGLIPTYLNINLFHMNKFNFTSSKNYVKNIFNEKKERN